VQTLKYAALLFAGWSLHKTVMNQDTGFVESARGVTTSLLKKPVSDSNEVQQERKEKKKKWKVLN